MAPATEDRFSAPGAVTYGSNNLVVGDGTWDFDKNTFLLPNLQGLPYETMRYNGMGNRFSTLSQYHRLVLAHGIMAVMIFLFLIPFSVMTARFYAGRPGWAVKYHAQVNILAALMLIAVFVLGYFSVGPERSLTNPHHGIGVAIFTLFFLQLVGGRLIRRITKARSLRIMIHQWFGRAIALLGIIQIPLGLTLYGSPLYLFILYAVWMAILLVIYFILSYQAAGRRDVYMSGARSEIGPSEATRTRVTESEYLSDYRPNDGEKSKARWLGPLAAGAGLMALARGRGKKNDDDRSRIRSRSPSLDRSRGPEVIGSRVGSASYLTGGEKYSDLAPPVKDSGGGGFAKFLGILGMGKLASGLANKRARQDEPYSEYSAVSTETPRRYRSDRRAPTMTDFTSVITDDTRAGPDMTRTSLVPPSGNPPPPVMSNLRSAVDSSRLSSVPPVTPRAQRARQPASRRSFEESDYSSYVSPSRRPIPEKSGGFAKGILGGLGMGWLAKKFADRRAQKEEQRLKDEEAMRSESEFTRYTGDGHPSPTRHNSRRPIQRRQTGYPDTILSTEMTESSIEPRPRRGNYVPPTEMSTLPPETSIMPESRHSASRSRHDIEPVSMPPMPSDPRGVLAPALVPTESTSSKISPGSKPYPSRQSRAGKGLEAGDAPPDRERYASPSLSMKMKVHDDKDRNVTLRRLTEDELKAARGRRDSESSISGFDSPNHGRRRYRRDSSNRRAEAAAERRAEQEDLMAPLSPPNPAFAKQRKNNKDSAYYSGQPAQPAQSTAGPSGSAALGSVPFAGQTVSSLGSMGQESHGTWSCMTPSHHPANNSPPEGSAADNRRRRRLERRRASGADKPVAAVDMFD